MEIGRIKETIRQRAVLKKIKTHRQEVLQGADSDSQTVQFLQDGECVMVSDTMYGMVSMMQEQFRPYLQVQLYDILNRLFAAGAEPFMMTVVLMFPEQTKEEALRFFMDSLTEVCEQERIQLSDVKAECSPSVTQVLAAVNIFGKKEKEIAGAREFTAGRELVMLGTAAAEGTVMLNQMGQEALRQRFSKRFLERVQQMSSDSSLRRYLCALQEIEPTAAVYAVGRSGMFGALWEISSLSGKGFCVDLSKILILQETIEICEFFDVNPYMLRSGGTLLAASDHGFSLVDSLHMQGISAAVIGVMQHGADKRIQYDGECRCLDMPKAVKAGKNLPKDMEWIY